MKAAPFFLTLALVACAPKATVVEEVPAQSPKPAPAQETAAAQPEPDLPAPPSDDLGLLDPAGLTDLPDENAMRPTNDTAEARPVIAAPRKD
jgi:hypothetical protein